MDYQELIKNWHYKATDEDFFSRFVFEYLAFIAFLRKVKFVDATTDRHALQRLKQDGELKSLYLEMIHQQRDINESWRRIMDELSNFRLGNVSGNGEVVEEVKWWNCSHNNLEEQTQEEKDKIKGIITNLEDWENMIEFWSAIRNNLFHGGKNPEEARDKILVRNGFITLRALMEILIETI